MDASKIVGTMSVLVSCLFGYWLLTPSKTLDTNPAFSIILTIMAAIFAGFGIFILFYGYMFNAEEGD